MKHIIAILCIFVFFACSQDDSHQQARPDAGSASSGQINKLTWHAPEGWQQETPRSSMRKAQYRLAKVAGDPEDASVVIFYFRGQGGSVQANIERWYGQFRQPDGKPTAETAKVSTSTENNLKQTVVEITGTYLFKQTPMSSQVTEKPNFKMLGGIVESHSGPWFIKMVGPANTIDKWRDSFFVFMKSFSETQ